MADEVETNPDSPEDGPIFRLEYQGCSATGVPLEGNKLLVRAGAVGRSETGAGFENSAPESNRQIRQQLIKDRKLLIDGDRATLTVDHIFNSPSAAGNILTGIYAGFWLYSWKDEEGRNLSDFKRDPASFRGRGSDDQRDFSPTDLVLRRSWHNAHLERLVADEDWYLEAMERTDGFAASAEEALSLLADLRDTENLEVFRNQMQQWAMKPNTLDFNGFSGQLLLNLLVKRTGEPLRLARLLSESLTAPSSADDAISKIRSLVDYVEVIREGANPAPGHVPFFLSYFWGLADRSEWPVMWRNSATYIEYSTGEKLPADPAERYRVFLDRVRELNTDMDDFENTATWWNRRRPVFLDRVLCERVELGLDEEGASTAERVANARAMVSIAQYWGDQLVEDVSEALNQDVSVRVSPLHSAGSDPRADLWVDWRDNEVSELSIRLWVNDQGAAVAVRPGEERRGWWDEVAPILEKADYPGCQVLGGSSSRIGHDVGLGGRHWAEFVYGRWLDRAEFAEVDLKATVVEVAKQLKPLYNKLHSLALAEPSDPASDPLAPFVAEFKEQEQYPNWWDKDNRNFQERCAKFLTPEVIAFADPSDIRLIWSKEGGYGRTGGMLLLDNSFPEEPTEEQYERMITAIRYLCWGEGTDAERIDSLLDPNGELYIRGLGENVIMKLLALTKPDVYLPLFAFHGPAGKGWILWNLGLDEPNGTRGEVQVESNRLLCDRLQPFFPGDLWGMGHFLRWYIRRLKREGRDSDQEDQGVPDRDVIGELAEELLVEREFIENIIGLLQDKGQVIFYGPPGTGKTYLARELAKALTSDGSRRALVQFHPSSSYEDFFEGFRPHVEDGEMTYRLTPGPLRRISEQASADPGRRHVMIIDEINRANLPKVFGELLFLLEYRDEGVHPLYRPDEEFSLPRNLWFIGTMNTADRSIALIDAALRRRFHFVPFFPNRRPVEGLLKRWLATNNEPDWVWELVDQVNDELEKELSGPHLLLGPSHFMKKGLSKEAVKRIWQYNIEPFIEDQFFGDRQKIDSFRFEAVYKRYMELSGRGEMADTEAEAQEAVGPNGGEVSAAGVADSPVGGAEGPAEGGEAETPDA